MPTSVFMSLLVLTLFRRRYRAHDEALACSNFVSETKLDNRVIRCEMDGGFREGRQFGRGLSGGQVRDDRRSKDEYDPGRGGYGRSDVASSHHFRRSNAPRKRSRGDSITDELPRKHAAPLSPSSAPQVSLRAQDLVRHCSDACWRDDEQEEENPRFRERENDQDDDQQDDLDAVDNTADAEPEAMTTED